VSDATDKPARSLAVLPHSGLGDRLKAEFAADPARSRSADAPAPIDDAAWSASRRALRDRVIGVMRSVYDPEIPVNIFDLGLIYAIDVSESGAVAVRMTLTAPGCPVAGTLPNEIRRKVEGVEGVTSAAVELVWNPPWHKGMMSEAALLELGLL
jgi:FeS assembly SUF system protein